MLGEKVSLLIKSFASLSGRFPTRKSDNNYFLIIFLSLRTHNY